LVPEKGFYRHLRFPQGRKYLLHLLAELSFKGYNFSEQSPGFFIALIRLLCVKITQSLVQVKFSHQLKLVNNFITKKSIIFDEFAVVLLPSATKLLPNF
jgi:hypothetical protein